MPPILSDITNLLRYGGSGMAESGDVVVVTGGNGFVGQHVIKLLHQNCQDEVKEIRVFDIVPYTQKLDFKVTIPTESIQGDITNLKDVSRVVRGADCVIHVAGVISIGTHPDVKKMQAINVDGTNIVVEACLLNSVKRLVQTSSIDAVSPLRDCVEEDELSLPYPPQSELAMPEYAFTKQKAEQLVLGSHGRPLANGSGLFETVSVRPTGMYGELDVYLIATLIKRAASRGGVAFVVGPRNSESCVHEVTYVGNAAWGHVCAYRTLRDNPAVCGGKAYFITDDSPRLDMIEHSSPFLKARGFRLGSFKIPFRLAYFIIMMLQILVTLLWPIKTINLPVNLKMLDYINFNYTFRRTRANNDLGYRPLFSYEESVKNSVKYYKAMKI